jgi:hypothetical protein
MVGIGLLIYPLSHAAAGTARLVVRLLSALCWFFLVPYKLTRWIEEPAALERTFLILGGTLAIAGIVLTATTDY